MEDCLGRDCLDTLAGKGGCCDALDGDELDCGGYCDDGECGDEIDEEGDDVEGFDKIVDGMFDFSPFVVRESLSRGRGGHDVHLDDGDGMLVGFGTGVGSGNGSLKKVLGWGIRG